MRVVDIDGDGPLERVTQVEPGSTNFTCARVWVGGTSEEARCWGSQWNGAIGDGANGLQPSPNPVVARTGPGRLREVAQITTGSAHSCARLTSGEARCWGQGGIGNGEEGEWNRPQIVLNPSGPGRLTGVRRIDAGGQHTCAVVGGGEVRCWGRNAYGQLGDGAPSGQTRNRPVAVLA